MEKKKKIILIISLATLLFSALGFSAFATNSFTESEGSLIQQTIAIESIEMIGDQSENVVDMYTMPYQAFISDDFRRMNTNIAGAGAVSIRSSQAVHEKNETYNARKWTTDVSFQYQETLRERLVFNIGDFVYNNEADDMLRTDYAPSFILGGYNVISAINVEYKYTMTGYNEREGEWITLNITRTQRILDRFEQDQPLIHRTSLAMVKGNYGFTDDVIISNVSTTIRAEKVTENGTAVPFYLQNFSYDTYTSENARTVSDVLVNTNEAVNALPEATNFWDWLVDSTESVLAINIFYEFTIGDLLYCIMGVAIVLIFLKIFAGG